MQGTKIGGLKPASRLRAANTTFVDPEAHDAIQGFQAPERELLREEYACILLSR
jgi:hypothetical protein